jgi:hypothetical protein
MNSENETPINIFGGVNFTYAITNSFWIGTGLTYADKGFVRDNSNKGIIDLTGKSPQPYDISKVTVRANYLEVPLFIQYSLQRSQRVHLYLALKYLPAFLLNHRTEFKYNKFGSNQNVEDQYKNNISSFVTAYGAGVGADIKIAEKTWIKGECTLRAHTKKTDFKNVSRIPYPGFSAQTSLLFDLN